MAIGAAFGKPSKEIFRAMASTDDEAKMLEEQHAAQQREQDSMRFR